MKAIIKEETVNKKRTIYKAPKKIQHFTRNIGKNGKVKVYSEEEVFLYKLRAFKSLFNFQTI